MAGAALSQNARWNEQSYLLTSKKKIAFSGSWFAWYPSDRPCQYTSPPVSPVRCGSFPDSKDSLNYLQHRDVCQIGFSLFSPQFSPLLSTDDSYNVFSKKQKGLRALLPSPLLMERFYGIVLWLHLSNNYGTIVLIYTLQFRVNLLTYFWLTSTEQFYGIVLFNIPRPLSIFQTRGITNLVQNSLFQYS